MAGKNKNFVFEIVEEGRKSIFTLVGYDFILLFYPVIAFFVLLMKSEILSVRK